MTPQSTYGLGLVIQHEVLLWDLQYGQSFYYVRLSQVGRFRRRLSDWLLDAEIAVDDALDYLTAQLWLIRLRWLA